jgi:hypothetical protein
MAWDLGGSEAEAVDPAYFRVNHESRSRDSLCEISRVYSPSWSGVAVQGISRIGAESLFRRSATSKFLLLRRCSEMLGAIGR